MIFPYNTHWSYSLHSSAEGDMKVTVITVPTAPNIIEIKSLKPILLQFLPGNASPLSTTAIQ